MVEELEISSFDMGEHSSSVVRAGSDMLGEMGGSQGLLLDMQEPILYLRFNKDTLTLPGIQGSGLLRHTRMLQLKDVLCMN